MVPSKFRYCSNMKFSNLNSFKSAWFNTRVNTRDVRLKRNLFIYAKYFQ